MLGGMNDMMKKFNLANLISTGSIILSGRDKGEKLREKINLDFIEENEDVIEITIPNAIVSFNSSYFLGLFTPSIKKFKTKEAFLSKYHFVCDEFIQKDINDGIEEALKLNNLL